MSFFSEEAFDFFNTDENESNNTIQSTIIAKRSAILNSGEAEPTEDLRKKIKIDNNIKVTDEFSTQVQRTLEENGETSELNHSVRHEVAIPRDYSYIPLSEHKGPTPPYREYPFKLDPFQHVSIQCIERSESVLVSAHTSAGKTVIAEYAISMSLKNKQRVIYTSPIKALSNQKYREFHQEFVDVGLMTGDVTINPTASCLVMTTEILRSMLYRGSEVMREVAWVVFDEIHYMRDKERGVVWEETLILLPDQVHYVFLSATIPNAKQFAEWICDIHQQPCHVVYTDYRPTPLQHYLSPAGGEGIHLAVDEKGVFREDNFLKALSVLGVEEDPLGAVSGKKKQKKPVKNGPSDIFKIIKMIMAKSYQPVIVFSFSKRECEANALQLSKMEYNNEEETSLVDAVFMNALEALNEDDRMLPQIENILPLLRRGIGVHHSGLLPILKEIIEILFQEGLIKVLFATETFSIGLNMPAKTVVFTSARKFDGKDFRWVSSGEYIQMSGRAGRRGLDDRGIVILMLDEKMEPAIAKNMLKGQADPLNSAFHLTYNMILNLLRVEGINPDYILERSFFQFQNSAALPGLELQLQELEEQKNAITIDRELEVSEYYDLKEQLTLLLKDYRTIVHHPSNCLAFLQPGRLVKVKTEKDDFGWGCLVNMQKKKKEKDTVVYILDVLLYCEKNSSPPVPAVEKGEFMVVPVVLETLNGISSVRIYLPKDIRSLESRMSVYKSIQEIKKRLSQNVPLLDPIQDMKIKDESFARIVKKIEVLQSKLESNEIAKSNESTELYEKYCVKMELDEKIKVLKKHIKDTTSILHMSELKCRKRVLRRLELTSASDVIELKGRVACEISTSDELLLTEMIFNGAFSTLSVDQTVALLSCFVFQEKSDANVKLKEELAAPLRMMQEAARRIAKISIESKLSLDEEAYVMSFRPELMDVVYAWCQGAKFSEICKMTDVFEGSIIRAMRRLEELLRQMSQAAKSIGNMELENKFAEGINKIKRDIVFANSLYL